MKGATILVVEDNPITRRMMRFALESEGLRVLEAGEGRTACELARTQVPDLVLQDYVLPDMDGLQLVEGLRALPGMATTPIIVITGMVSQLDDLRRRGLANTLFLAKPIEPSRLLEVVRSHLAAQAAPAAPAGRRVLVVDDEPLNVKLAALRLRDAGFEVETAGGAEEALQRARARVPDAILSDVLMPGIDGFLLCDAVRRDPRLARVPVVLLSAAYVDDADQALAREMGASALLVRTPDFAAAIAALGNALHAGAAAPASPHGQERETLHKERLQIQLERQLARNDALLRQGAIQAAALSVVRGLAEALAKPRDLASVLGDVLVHCLDATGLSTGLLYLVAPDGSLQLRAQAGLPAEARVAAAGCFGQARVLRRALEGTAPVAFSAARGTDVELRSLTEQLGRTSILVIPFVVAEERVGVLLLAADEQDFADPAWLGFASTLARQFGQTIAVGQSLFRGAASEARYRTLMEHANDAILLVDHGGIVEANQRAEALLGRNRSAIVGRPFDEFVGRTDGGTAVLHAGETTRTEEQLLTRADGTTVPADVSASLVQIGEETIVLLILRDITERKRAEEKLKSSEEQYRLLFDSNPHPMWVYDPATLAFLAVNDAAVRLYGYARDEFLGMTIKDIRPADEVPRMLARVAEVAEKDARPTNGTWRHCRRDGTVMDVDIRSHRITFHGQPACLVLAMDVSEKRRLETQLRQAQKMEAVGRLAGGVAHDFNNLLGVISGYSELLGKSLGPQHPGQRRVAEIHKAAERASALTRQLLAFSRKQVLETKVLRLNEVVSGLAGMLHRLIGEDVRLVTRPRADLGQVRADQGQLEQVIVNLVVNGRDAMIRGGDLVIETSNATIDETYCRQHGDVTPGRYVTIAVSDTGEGMSAETQSHIFEPFFTTKADGRGTGLGLATVFGIVKQSGGHVSVHSELGKGSTFRVYLPRTDEVAEPEVAAPEASDLTGQETILLVEDAETLRVMTREILEGAGYAVIEAASPDAALAQRDTLGGVKVLLTDVVMPGMSGPDLAKDLRRTRPDLKILFMSGYTEQAVGNHGVFETDAQFLQKPFTTDSLLRKVRAVLDARAG
jgi:two-component system cell cycle sensor histidine kinase/response regulator CckA